jgi:sRNA-binding protein
MTEEELRARWPAAFDPAKRLPLALGIHANMGIAYGDSAMSHWTTHPKYLRNQLAGAARIDLEGNAVGVVTQEERETAWRALLEIRTWIYRQERERLMNPIKTRWLSFSEEDERQEMKQQMPRFPKQQ